MAVLTALLTHLAAPRVAAQLAYLRALAPEGRFVVCHGGERGEFDRLGEDDALFVADPSLRGPHFEQSLNETLRAVYDARVRDDPSVTYVYAIEYDHLVLRTGFADRLVALAERTGAGLLAKWASPRNDTNWPHYLAARDDAELNGFVDRISVREDRDLRLGCLGTGMLLRRDALEALCTQEGAPARYFELFVPTVVHHLGFGVVDVDAVSDLYACVRWTPEYSLEDVRAARDAGRTFIHPFKQVEALASLGTA